VGEISALPQQLAAEDGTGDDAAAPRLVVAPTIDPPRPALRRTLIAADAALLLLAWSTAFLGPWAADEYLSAPLASAIVLALATVALHAAAGLYRARVCSVRATEVARLSAVSFAVGVLAVAIASASDHATVEIVMVGAVASLLTVIAGRSCYRNWLLAQRATGKLSRSVAIVGADEEASLLAEHLAEHPEVGYRVVGFLRSSALDAGREAHPILGEALDAPSVLRRLGLTGAVVVPGALHPIERQEVVSMLVGAGVHVHVSTGLRGIDSRRLRSLPMGHEPLMYLEPAGAEAPWYACLKRVIDIVGATVALVLASPFLVIAAVAIKLTDSGPILFRQERAGMGNRPFDLLKLRSMTVDAEERLAELMEHNQRDGGPLFKLDNDPRVTRVGAILRATSFDEIPQLFNVLRGEMSLVGPRPALLDEVAEFDEELQARQRVRPGVTGLWQVEARDNPSFSAYRYLDVFYVENQSLALDLTILIGTVRAVAASCLRAVRVRSNESAAQPAPVAERSLVDA
jgi:exopolysaccharide biosynthesis polyprenyl glycosylphosphotransferase